MSDWVVEHGSEEHSHCPGCGTDVEPTDGFGGENGVPRLWSQYVHDRKDDGAACGATWTVTSEAGRQRNEERGLPTKWVSTSAQRGRSYSMPSRAYEQGWERIYGDQ